MRGLKIKFLLKKMWSKLPVLDGIFALIVIYSILKVLTVLYQVANPAAPIAGAFKILKLDLCRLVVQKENGRHLWIKKWKKH